MQKDSNSCTIFVAEESPTNNNQKVTEYLLSFIKPRLERTIISSKNKEIKTIVRIEVYCSGGIKSKIVSMMVDEKPKRMKE